MWTGKCGVILVWSCILVLAASPALATSLVRHNFVCPLCGKVYQDLVVASTNTFGGQDSEFRIYSSGLQPLHYSIHTCPACGCPDQASLFPQPGAAASAKLNDREKREITKRLQAFFTAQQIAPPQLTTSQKYQLLAELLAWRGLSSFKIAEAFMNAAWGADDEGNPERAKILRERASHYFVHALGKQEISAEETPIVQYLVGETCRRAGNFDQALKLLSQVRTADPRLMKLCRQQQELAKKKDTSKAKAPNDGK